jgi:predicted transcriptional regulator
VLQEKARTLLVIADMKVGSPERWAALQVAAERYSWRAINKKMEELVDRGYVEPLRSGTAQGNLTAKGKDALASPLADPPSLKEP